MTLPTPDRIYNATITRIIDGDTYDVEVDVGFRIVARMPLRLAHADAPEHDTPEGQAAIVYVTQLFGPLPVTVAVQTYKPIDKYGRYLASVLLDRPAGVLDVATNLIATGHAKPYEGGAK